MSEHIFRQFAREVRKAFLRGAQTVRAFNKTFIIEPVTGSEYRLTTEAGDDIGFRFTSDGTTFNFAIA